MELGHKGADHESILRVHLEEWYYNKQIALCQWEMLQKHFVQMLLLIGMKTIIKLVWLIEN